MYDIEVYGYGAFQIFKIHSFLKFFHYVYMGILPDMTVCHVCLHAQHTYTHTHAQCSKRLKESIRCSQTGVTDHCEPPFKCQELNPGPVEECQFSTAESSLQPPKFHIVFPRYTHETRKYFCFILSYIFQIIKLIPQ